MYTRSKSRALAINISHVYHCYYLLTYNFITFLCVAMAARRGVHDWFPSYHHSQQCLLGIVWAGLHVS